MEDEWVCFGNVAVLKDEDGELEMGDFTRDCDWMAAISGDDDDQSAAKTEYIHN